MKQKLLMQVPVQMFLICTLLNGAANIKFKKYIVCFDSDVNSSHFVSDTMSDLKKTSLFILTIAILIQTKAQNPSDDVAIVKDADHHHYVDPKQPVEIIWPKGDEKDEEAKEPRSKSARFLTWYYPQNKMMDVMMQSMGTNYQPQSKDPFDFLKDSYPLPKGKILI